MEAILSAAKRSAIFTPRLLGTLGLIGSPLLVLGFLTGTISNFPHKDFIGALLGFLYMIGWLCSVIGMRKLRATGQGIGSRIAFITQIIGLILAATLNLKEMTDTTPDQTSLIFHITDAGYPFSHVFMIVGGVLIVRAKVWFGWRRASAFVCGLALPLTMLIGTAIGFAGGMILFGGLTVCGLALFANAVRTGDEISDVQQTELK